MNVTSNLGQPLKAEIELVSVDKADRSSISAKLASAEAFKNAGIDYPYTLPKLKFEVISSDSGEPIVKVTSGQPINEPFVTLLVEVTWSSGKLMREYTFLLDPADFKPQELKSETVNPIEPVILTPVAPPASTETAPVEPQPNEGESASAPATTPSVGTESPSAQPAAKPTVPTDKMEEVKLEAVTEKESPVSQESLSKEGAEPVQITVFRGDTLSWIANQTKPADVSLARMLVAMYRANSDAFVAKNMNRLKTGKIIRVPTATEIEAVKQSDAVKVVHAQVADWNAYRQQLAAMKAQTTEHVGTQESSGKVNAVVAEKVPAVKESAKEVLKLSKGEAPGDKAVGGGKATAQDKKNAIEEETIAKAKALKEAQDRTAMLEKNVKDLQKLAELKKQSVAVPAPAPSAAVSVGTLASASAVAAASAPVAVVHKPVQEPKVVTQPSFLDEVLTLVDPLMLAGGAAAILGLGGVGMLLVRRRKNAGSSNAGSLTKSKKTQKTDMQDDAGSASGRFVAPVMPSPETGDFTKTASLNETPVNHGSEEVDPIGEADLFLTFGRDAQAEEVLKEALKTNPSNNMVRLKLLSIYANRKDINAFSTYAREIKDTGDDSAWNQASALGRELEPGNPLYGGDGSLPAHVITTKLDKSAPAADFDLGFGAPGIALTPAANQQSTVVVVPPSQEITAILPTDVLRTAQLGQMDFDVTGSQPEAQGGTTGEAANLEDMVFDVTSSHTNIPAMRETSSSAAGSPASSVDDLIFDVTSNKTNTLASAASTGTAQPDAADSMAFTLDFPSEFKAEPAARKAEAAAEIGLGEINLNLDGMKSAAAAPSASVVKDENWQEVTTKLDLAKAYQEMGDAAGAKEILDEVLRDGDEQQRSNAQSMLQQL